jgi:hypothetical protein
VDNRLKDWRDKPVRFRGGFVMGAEAGLELTVEMKDASAAGALVKTLGEINMEAEKDPFRAVMRKQLKFAHQKEKITFRASLTGEAVDLLFPKK